MARSVTKDIASDVVERFRLAGSHVVERFRLAGSHVVERLFRCHGRGVEADVEYLLDSTVAGWRRARRAVS